MCLFWEQYNSSLLSAPQAVALVDDCHSYTRAELDKAAEAVASSLRASGIGPGKIRVIELERCAQTYMEMLGTWKAGAGFVVCEKPMPPERLDYIRRDVATYAGPIIPAVVVYTSGSTGTPKRVVHGYGTLDLILRSGFRNGGHIFSSGMKYCSAVPLTTIAAIIQIVGCFANGQTLYVVSPEIAMNPKALADYFSQNHIQQSFLPTSLARLMPSFGPDFRRLLVGAEPLDGFAYAGIDICDCYALSEAGFLTIVNGVPFAGGNVRVEEGEIVFDNPYLYLEDNATYPTYHTHDAGRQNADGTIQVLGRLDDQITIGGNRIEPSEIEQAALSLAGVQDACARGFHDQDGTFIILYFTASHTPNAVDFETVFLERLPYVMMPLVCVRLKEFPHLPHGKVDKKSLGNMPQEEVIPLSTSMDSLGRVFASARLARYTETEIAVAADEDARKRLLPLTLYQQFYLESELRNEGGLPLNILYEFTFHNPAWSFDDLRNAWKTALKNHPAFNMILVQDGDRVFQKYSPEGEFEIACETPKPFQMWGKPLTRIAFWQDDDSTTRILLEAHHIITDGYSILLLLKDVKRVLEGKTLSRDFYCKAVERISSWQSGADFEQTLEEYQKTLSDDWCTKPPFEATAITGNIMGTEEITEDCQRLDDIPTWKIVVAALMTLHETSGRSKVAISYTHNGRIDGELAACCGLLLTNIPIRFEFADGWTARQLEAAVKRQLRVTHREAWCPYSSIASDNWENTGYDDDYLELYDNRVFYSGHGTGCEAIDLSDNASLIADTACELYVNGSQAGQTYIDYNASLYTSTTMKAFLKRFMEIINQ